MGRGEPDPRPGGEPGLAVKLVQPCTSCRRRGAYIGTVHDVLSDLLAVWRAGGTAGVATVVRTFHSAPRLPGAAMVVAPDGTVSGSVSGGCVEGAVYELATEVTATGVPVLQRYGVSDDDAFAVGLTCGGIHRHLRRTGVAGHVSPSWRPSPTTSPRIDRSRSPPSSPIPTPTWVGRRLVVGGTRRRGSLGSRARRRRRRRRRARPAGRRAAARCSPTVPTGSAGARAWRCSSPATRRGPRMLVFGAIDFAAALAQQGSLLGYRVTVCDARPVFATRGAVPRPPTRSSSTGRTATWPRRWPAGRDRRAHRDLRAHPRSQVRRAAAGGRAAAAGGRLHRRDGVAPHARRSAWTGCARRA